MSKSNSSAEGGCFRGGRKKYRDKWYGYGGRQFAPFRRWVHKEVRPSETNKNRPQLSKEEIWQLYDRWSQLNPGKKSRYTDSCRNHR